MRKLEERSSEVIERLQLLSFAIFRVCVLVCVHVGGHMRVYMHMCVCMLVCVCMWVCMSTPGVDIKHHLHHFSTLFTEAGALHQTQSLQLILIATFISGNPLSWSSEAGITGKPLHKPSIH